MEDSGTLNDSTDLSAKAQDQLLKVIKFLRQEKDVAVAKSEILQAESLRLKTQLTISTKQLEEAKDALKNSQETSDAAKKASAKHAELLRKIDTLNAITDSNRILREDRDKLQAEVKKLKEEVEKITSQSKPLMVDISKLNEKVESLTTENQALMMDVAKWKQRAERSTKGTPEDWRRLTNERENLAKQWQIEKNNNEKLEDETKRLKQEKLSLNEQLVQIQKNLLNETNEVKRLSEDSQTFKQQFIKTSEALNSLKTQLHKMTEESTKLSKEVETKDTVISDLKIKEEKVCKKHFSPVEEIVLFSRKEDTHKFQNICLCYFLS